MPVVSVTVSPEVADALGRQARALQLGRRQYVRSLLAAAASTSEVEAPSPIEPKRPASQMLAIAGPKHGDTCGCWSYTASLPPTAVDALNRQARELFLTRAAYVGGLLEAVAAYREVPERQVLSQTSVVRGVLAGAAS